jgi:16S rRNA (uracil1498-N3)-methyltransferase
VRRRFFVEQFVNHTAAMRGEGAHHLGRVLRAEPGQVFELSDGSSVFLAKIKGVSRDRIDFALLEPIAVPPPRLHLALLLSIVKFERFEWALEKATELGVDEIVPLAAERSERALVSAAAKRATRWRKILLESAQQARCLRPPVLASISKPPDAFRKVHAPMRVILSERPEAPSFRSRFASCGEASSRSLDAPGIALAVGPEGGWTPPEFAAAAASEFQEASLGSNILRTETAVTAALAGAHLFFGG